MPATGSGCSDFGLGTRLCKKMLLARVNILSSEWEIQKHNKSNSDIIYSEMMVYFNTAVYGGKWVC